MGMAMFFCMVCGLSNNMMHSKMGQKDRVKGSNPRDTAFLLVLWIATPESD